MRGTLSAWQPPMAPPLSLWCQHAPPFPACPLWVSGFPSTQTQSQAAPISRVAPGKSLPALGVSCLVLTGWLGAGNESAESGRLNVGGSREALGKWKWPLCDHLAGCQGVPEWVFTRLYRGWGDHTRRGGSLAGDSGERHDEGLRSLLVTTASQPGAGCRGTRRESVHSLAESRRRQAGDAEDLSRRLRAPTAWVRKSRVPALTLL